MTALMLTCSVPRMPIHEPRPRFRFRFLRWIASHLPLREILAEGPPYLERYYIAGPISDKTANLWPELDRPKARLAWLPRTWYLHRFHAPDPDRALHDHPWAFRGRVLAGAYAYTTRETAPLPTGALLLGAERHGVSGEGDRTAMNPGSYHRIEALLRAFPTEDPENEVWTLLRAGANRGTWGYLVGTEHVPHGEYHDRPRRLHTAARRRAGAQTH